MTLDEPVAPGLVVADDRVLWWLSFVDPARAASRGRQVPGGPGFLGVAVVAARPDVLSAAQRARELGCNPGGEVKGWWTRLDDPYVPDRFRDRLLTREDVAELEDLAEREGHHA